MGFRPGDVDPQQVLTASARPNAALWRLVAGVVVMSATWLALLWRAVEPAGSGGDRASGPGHAAEITREWT